MPAAAGELYQATYDQLLDGQVCQSVLMFRAIVTPGPTIAAIRLSAEKFLAALRPMQSSNVAYPKISLKQMTPVPFDEDVWVPTTFTTGESTDAPLSNTLAAVITKRTGVAGKTHRGRLYVAGFKSGATVDNNNSLGSTGVALMNGFGASMLDFYGLAGSDTNFQLGVYSRVLGGSSPMTVAGWQLITRWDGHALLGNQRRRRLGRGI